MPVTLDKKDPKYWEDVPAGSIINLTDKQSIDSSLEEHGHLDGASYTVAGVQRILERNGVLTWLILKLESKDDRMWLIVKIVDNEFSVYVYFTPEDFEPGNRRDCMTHLDKDDDLDMIWIFQEPDAYDSEEDDLLDFMSKFDPLKMQYATSIEWSEDAKDIEYLVKKQGEMHGSVIEAPSYLTDDLMATIVEYKAEGAQNPEAMFLEIGAVDAEQGGLIQLLMGTEIQLSEIEVLRA